MSKCTKALLLLAGIQAAQGNCTVGTSRYIVDMQDSLGDGWNGNDMRLVDCTTNKTAIDPAHDPITLSDGFSATTYLCIPHDLEEYELSVGGAYWGEEISWTITKESDDSLWHEGGSPYEFSTCPTPSPTACPNLRYTVEMSDSYGDGWEGNEIVIFDCDGNLLKDGITLEDGAEGSQEICLDTSRFEVQCGGGGFTGEVSWQIIDEMYGVVAFSGGAPADMNNCPSCEDQGGKNLTVYVHSAHLPNGGDGEWYDPEADAYTKVRVDSKAFFTSVIDDNNDPVWNKLMFFGCVTSDTPLEFQVWDEDSLMNPDDLLVQNIWSDWASWKPGHLKRLNDTTSTNSEAYRKEYYVEVSYYWGDDVITFEPTAMPISNPTMAPVFNPSAQPTSPSVAPISAPTPAPPTPLPPSPAPPTPVGSPTRAPHVYYPPTAPITRSPTHMPTKGPGGKHGSSSDSTNVGSVFAGIFGVLVFFGLVYFAVKYGYCVVPMFVRDKLVNLDVGMSSYSPMGAASQGYSKSGTSNNMNFKSLKDEVNAPPQRAGGYVPPVLATMDDDEEEVSLGGIGRSAVV